MIITSVLSSTLFGDIAPEYFGNPGQSLYSTFRLFTIEGWFDIPDAIAANSSHGMAEGNNEDVLVKLEEMEKMIKELKEEKELTKKEDLKE